MSPVIRVPDGLYDRLESLSVGFDTPSNVIERLIDFWDENNSLRKSKSIDIPTHNIISKSIKSFSSGTKKPRDPQKEKELKNAVGRALNWGNFRLYSNSMLEYYNSDKKVLCKYSSYSSEYKRWFWGVASKYWKNWDNNTYLALLMENDDLENYSYLLLEPNDAKFLLTKKCSESNGEKKINLRFYTSGGKYHLQEWQEYSVEKNTKDIIN